MKTIYFLRHAKSDWDADYGEDHDRPLAKRGVKAAKKMGELFTSLQQLPDTIVCSTAFRARDTLALARKKGNWPDIPTRHTDTLYHGHSGVLLETIQSLPNRNASVMLVGHEPVWSETISRLIGGGDIRFPTAAAARIDAETEDWARVNWGLGQLIWLIPPRLLTG